MAPAGTFTEQRPLLPGELEDHFSQAMPRLARIAHLRGVPSDAVDDVVQQTLFEAWRSVSHLRDAERLDAWLDGICRNLCRRYQRAAGADQSTPFSTLATEADAPFELADEGALDLDEVLDAEDRARLLDRALGHLPVATRRAVEACYLAELPSGEAALQLGLTINALEVRLHRARQQLRQVLHGPLRAEAASLGILLVSEESEGWRETREWCIFCGQHRMRGMFDPQPNGSTGLRLRCPACSPKYETDIESSGGLAELSGLRSFKVALRRYRAASSVYYRGLREGHWRRCPRCGGETQVRVTRPGDPESIGERWYAIIECERCEESRGWWAGMALWSSPDFVEAATRWLDDHPRSRIEPDVLTTHGGHPAVHSRIVDVVSGRAAVIFTDPERPRVLGFHEE